MTEITDNIDTRTKVQEAFVADRGVIFFDAGCGVCRGGARRFHRILQRAGYRLEPLQSDEATRTTGVTIDDLMREMYMVTSHAEVLCGVDALLEIASHIAWMRPIAWLGRIPGVRPIVRIVYRAIAKRRYRISAVCGLTPERSARRWGVLDLVPAVLIGVAFAMRSAMPAWGWMWALAFSIFFACKWATWRSATRNRRHAGGYIGRDVAYLLAYPGMNAREFLFGASPERPTRRDWIGTIAKTIAGAVCIWLLPRYIVVSSPLFAGWSAMIGMALLCHFGLLNLIVLAWRRAGVAAEPLMRQPTRATSLTDFWGRRWNSGFHDLAVDWIFRPLAARRFGVAICTAGVFLASGILHDAVVSLPARAGYGLPTLYFLIQCAGVLIERTRPMRKLIRRPAIGWLYTLVVTLAPMPLLFHASFVHRVILPFLHVIGGLS